MLLDVIGGRVALSIERSHDSPRRIRFCRQASLAPYRAPSMTPCVRPMSSKPLPFPATSFAPDSRSSLWCSCLCGPAFGIGVLKKASCVSYEISALWNLVQQKVVFRISQAVPRWEVCVLCWVRRGLVLKRSTRFSWANLLQSRALHAV